MKYRVIEQHLGDKQYWPGDEREINNAVDAERLKKMGLIGDAKEDKAPENKAEPDPDNKAIKGAKNK